jgi:Asp-tRNA(Asn)/Glu-tRNA(Gln) amidotransferase C subunit
MARGNEIKCMGEETEITIFAEKFNELIEYYRKYHRLDEQDIEKYLFDAEHMKSASNGEFEQVIILVPAENRFAPELLTSWLTG